MSIQSPCPISPWIIWVLFCISKCVITITNLLSKDWGNYYKLLQYSFAVWLQCPSSLGPGEFSICVLGPKSGSGLEPEKILWHSLGATSPWLLIFPPWLLIICIDSAVPTMAPCLFHSDENFALWTISIILSGSSPLDDFYHLVTHFDNWAHLTSDK